VGTRCADHVTPLYPLKLALLPPLTGGGRSVGIVRSRTEAMGVLLLTPFTVASPVDFLKSLLSFPSHVLSLRGILIACTKAFDTTRCYTAQTSHKERFPHA
jgi:hypothetical protein